MIAPLVVIATLTLVAIIVYCLLVNADRAKIEEKEPLPLVDRTYMFRPKSGSPFPIHDTHYVIVRDVKDGWVLYDWKGNHPWKNQSVDVYSFNYMYMLPVIKGD